MPKSKQINFFMDLNDLSAFDEYIHSLRDVAIIKLPLQRSQLNCSNTVLNQSDEEWIDVYLTKHQYLEDVLIQFVEAQNYWVIDELRSPVVQFLRCYRGETYIRRGRLYLVTEYYNEQGLAETKPHEFIDFGTTLINWIRTNYATDQSTGFYLGPNAETLAATGNVSLRPI